MRRAIPMLLLASIAGSCARNEPEVIRVSNDLGSVRPQVYIGGRLVDAETLQVVSATRPAGAEDPVASTQPVVAVPVTITGLVEVEGRKSTARQAFPVTTVDTGDLRRINLGDRTSGAIVAYRLSQLDEEGALTLEVGYRMWGPRTVELRYTLRFTPGESHRIVSSTNEGEMLSLTLRAEWRPGEGGK